MWSPRVGFNWDISGGSGKRRQIRGGLGLFTGRTPYVWLSNQYGNTGVDFTSLSVSYNANNKMPFVPDPDNQPTTVTGGSTGRQTINMIDPDYKYPEVDPREPRATITTSGSSVSWARPNSSTRRTSRTSPTRTSTTSRPAPSPTAATSTRSRHQPERRHAPHQHREGQRVAVAFKVERPFRNGFYVSGSYLFGESKSVNDGTSSVARSNWTGAPAASTSTTRTSPAPTTHRATASISR